MHVRYAFMGGDLRRLAIIRFFAACVMAVGARADCNASLTFDTDYRLSARDIAWLGRGAVLGNDDLVYVDPFDPAHRPRRGGKEAVAVVGAVEAGVGMRPVAGVLWAPQSKPYKGGVQLFRQGADLVAVARGDGENGDCDAGFELRLYPDGSVRVNGRPTGGVREMRK